MVTPPPPALWEGLTDSARSALVRIATELGAKYTGVIELDCNHGGVRRVRFGTEWRPGDREFRPGEPPRPTVDSG